MYPRLCVRVVVWNMQYTIAVGSHTAVESCVHSIGISSIGRCIWFTYKVAIDHFVYKNNHCLCSTCHLDGDASSELIDVTEITRSLFKKSVHIWKTDYTINQSIYHANLPGLQSVNLSMNYTLFYYVTTY